MGDGQVLLGHESALAALADNVKRQAADVRWMHEHADAL